MTACRQCVEAYQDYDHHAQEKYEEFESVLHKYLQSEEYSVKSCPEDCKDKGLYCKGAAALTQQKRIAVECMNAGRLTTESGKVKPMNSYG
ncbi:Transmembrane protein FAM155A [Tupaia chinensis]|uniref:Transmembrane protein FAM155A n=1 Tax=Tupaia chinensis TaxID=246437 RepID=L9JAS1_TUPCH|nr:Transmembrane protein FAM155A [Tupaia chinensis]